MQIIRKLIFIPYHLHIELKRSLNISGFGFFKIFPNGQYLHLTNGLTEFQKIYFEEISSLGIFEQRFQKIPMNESTHLVWSLPTDFNKDKILFLSHKQGFINGVDFYARTKEGIENFYFILSNNIHTDPSCLLNNHYISCLQDFMKYFKYKSLDLIDCSDQSKLAFYTTPYDLSFKGTTGQTDTVQDFKKNVNSKFFLLSHSGKIFNITKREKEIMEIIHKNSKEIASLLRISHKTVEGYIEKLKTKLGVYLKSNLVDISISNGILKSTLC